MSNRSSLIEKGYGLKSILELEVSNEDPNRMAIVKNAPKKISDPGMK